MRPLQRLGLDHHVVVVPALAVMAEPALAGPCLADHLHRLVEALGRLGHRDAEAVELGLAVALADTEVDAAAAQQIEGCRLFRNECRVVPRQHHHGGAEADVLGPRGEVGQHGHRGRDLALAGEMVLDHEELLEAEPVGFDHILDEALVALAVFDADAALGARAAEQAELHVALRWISSFRTHPSSRSRITLCERRFRTFGKRSFAGARMLVGTAWRIVADKEEQQGGGRPGWSIRWLY